MARTCNITVDALQDLTLRDTIYPDGTTDVDIDRGAAVPDNITGRSYQVVIHAVPGDGTPLLTYTTPNGGATIPTGTDGLLVTTIPVADVETLDPGDYVYYIRRTDAGNTAVVTKGSFSVVAV